MTIEKKDTQRHIAVMYQYLDGKCIQVSIRGGQWLDTPIPAWDWGFCDYQVVHESHRKPFPAGMICEAKTRDYIEVMRAHLQGKAIQKRKCGWRDTDEWIDVDSPKWNWGIYDYRVKPEEGGEQ